MKFCVCVCVCAEVHAYLTVTIQIALRAHHNQRHILHSLDRQNVIVETVHIGERVCTDIVSSKRNKNTQTHPTGPTCLAW